MQNKGLSVSQQGSSSVHTLPLQDQQTFNQPPLITSSFQCVHLHRRGWTSPQTTINPGAWPRSLSRSWMSANGEEKKKKNKHPISSKPGREREGDFGKFGDSSLFLFCRLSPIWRWNTSTADWLPSSQWVFCWEAGCDRGVAAACTAVTNVTSACLRWRMPESRADPLRKEHVTTWTPACSNPCFSHSACCLEPSLIQRVRWVSGFERPCFKI